MEDYEYIYGIKCKRETFKDGNGKKRIAYTFTVPGWEECTVTGIRAARLVIRARGSAVVRNTLNMD